MLMQDWIVAPLEKRKQFVNVALYIAISRN